MSKLLLLIVSLYLLRTDLTTFFEKK